MAPQFQPYQDRAGEETRNRWAQSLDGIFQEYQRAKMNAQAQPLRDAQLQAAKLQNAQAQRQGMMADTQETAQFGAPLAAYGPEGIRQAGIQSSPDFAGPMNPKYAKLAEGLHAISQKSKMAMQEQQADIGKKVADTGRVVQETENLKNGQVYVDPDSGRQIVVPRGAKLIPRPPQPKTLKAGSEELNSTFKLYEAAREGLISGLEGSETGPFVGRVPAVTSAQQVAEGGVAAMAPVLKQLFRVSGEGVFTDRDQELLLNMVPTRKDTPEARKIKMANIDNIVKAKLKMGGDSSAAPASSGPAVGTTKNGYRFRGGNPADKNSWEKI